MGVDCASCVACASLVWVIIITFYREENGGYSGTDPIPQCFKAQRNFPNIYAPKLFSLGKKIQLVQEISSARYCFAFNLTTISSPSTISSKLPIFKMFTWFLFHFIPWFQPLYKYFIHFSQHLAIRVPSHNNTWVNRNVSTSHVIYRYSHTESEGEIPHSYGLCACSTRVKDKLLSISTVYSIFAISCGSDLHIELDLHPVLPWTRTCLLTVVISTNWYCLIWPNPWILIQEHSIMVLKYKALNKRGKSIILEVATPLKKEED